MRVRRGVRVVAVGAAVAASGAVWAPAGAYHYDPVTQQWVIDCTSAPPFDSGKSKSGWQPFAGDQYQGRYYVGVRSNDPYYVAYADPNTQKVTVGVWQPWYDATPQAGGLVQGPWFLDQSVSVSPSGGVEKCDTSVGWPPVHPPAVPVAASQPAPAPSLTRLDPRIRLHR